MDLDKLQDLPPKWAKFCLSIQSFLEREINVSLRDKKLLVAFSAGPDSTALLRLFCFLSRRLNLKVAAAYLNHCMRLEADQEQEWARTLGSSLKIPVFCGQSSVPGFASSQRIGTEEAARILRYRFLRGTAHKIGADYILTGHHLNDLAEDVLMRLQRGAGWPALSGMQAFVPEQKVLRPFLLTPKAEILKFLEAIDQGFASDKSNQDPSYLRNRIRLELLPVLTDMNPGFLRAVADLWRLGRVDEEYWQGIWEEVKDRREVDENFLSREVLKSHRQASRLRLYKNMLDQLGPGQVLVTNILQLDAAWQGKRTGTRVQFPGNKTALLTKRGIEFSRGDA